MQEEYVEFLQKESCFLLSLHSTWFTRPSKLGCVEIVTPRGFMVWYLLAIYVGSVDVNKGFLKRLKNIALVLVVSIFKQ